MSRRAGPRPPAAAAAAARHRGPDLRPAGTGMLAASVGHADLTVCWYDGLWHEIYHEPERARPLADLREWLDARR